MPADGVMEGGSRGVERLEIRTTRPNADRSVLKALISLYILFASLRQLHAGLIKGCFLMKYCD